MVHGSSSVPHRERQIRSPERGVTADAHAAEQRRSVFEPGDGDAEGAVVRDGEAVAVGVQVDGPVVFPDEEFETFGADLVRDKG